MQLFILSKFIFKYPEIVIHFSILKSTITDPSKITQYIPY